MLIWFFLAGVLALWLVFGTIQDVKSREIANWVTLSLIGIGLAARLFYSIESKDWSFALIGLAMTLMFTAISFALYYSRVFAGGDAKLLMGLGAFIPGTTLTQAIFNGLSAVLVLLVVGAVYSMLFSIRIASKNKVQFKNEMRSRKGFYYFILPAVAAITFLLLKVNDSLLTFLGGLISLSLLLYPYFLAVDKCMIRKYSPKELTPGDWLQQDVVIGGRTIKSTVHGLSERDIALLIKARKNVLVKEGVPFVPVFLVTYAIMVFFFLSEVNLLALLS